MLHPKIYEDILHITFNDVGAMFAPVFRERFSSSNPMKRAKVCFMHKLRWIKRLVVHLFKNELPPVEALKDKLWFYAASDNQFHSLKPVLHYFPDQPVVQANHYKPPSGNSYAIQPVYLALFFWKFIPLFIWLCFKKGRITYRYFDRVFLAVGYYETFRILLKKYKPKAIVFANDHITEQRALLRAAQSLNIPTVYLQHASISAFYPPLRHDLNLLEGEDSLEKYKELGPVNGKVEFVGMPKFDPFADKRNFNKEVQKIGICCNVNDNLKMVNEAINGLCTAFPKLQITFRKHPHDNRAFDLPDVLNLAESDPKKEMIFEFMCGQDLIICGHSSLHLEAALMNIVSIYYEMNTDSKMNDYYGYVKQGLIEQVFDLQQLTQIVKKNLQKPENVYLKAVRYNAVIGTEWEGRSAEKAAQCLEKYLKNA